MRRTFDLGDTSRTQGGHGVYASAQFQLDNLTHPRRVEGLLELPRRTEHAASQPWRIYNASPPVEYNGPQRLRAIGNQRGGGVQSTTASCPARGSSRSTPSSTGSTRTPCRTRGTTVSSSRTAGCRLTKRHEYGSGINWSLDFQGGARFELFTHDVAITELPAGRPRPLDDPRPPRRDTRERRSRVRRGRRSPPRAADGSAGSSADFQIGGVALTYTWGMPLTVTLSLRWTDFQPGIVQARAMRGVQLPRRRVLPVDRGALDLRAGDLSRALRRADARRPGLLGRRLPSRADL